MQIMIVSLAALMTVQVALTPTADEKGSWVTTLGRDTVAVESVVRAGNHVAGDILVRIPSTVRLHYEVELRADGSVARSTLDTDPMGAKSIPAKHVVFDFDADSARSTIDSAGQKRKVARAMPRGTVPMFMTGFGASYGLYSSMGLYELLLERTKPAPNDTLKVPAIDIATGAMSKRAFLARSATQVDVDYFGILWTHLTIDASGQITAADARSTTEQTQSQRTGFVDVAAMAKSFASADHSGKGIGPASPNLIEKGSLGGQLVVVTYGSPRRRGRTVLGAVVPYDRVWRTGANEATVLLFDKDMTIGGSPVPAGAYSLWTIPKADGTVQLIINKQHGQWGTDYDSAQDLVRVPMKSSTAPSPQENFAINVAGSGNAGELRMSWDAFMWSVPIAMKQ
ncbi:MAG TPA: DUF2911 domain-containing protein [Gemmatimonadaceae bacterium]|nr:DUF2911 domain-containing protein [Gemmatimonadaceae bacterium]